MWGWGNGSNTIEKHISCLPSMWSIPRTSCDESITQDYPPLVSSEILGREHYEDLIRTQFPKHFLLWQHPSEVSKWGGDVDVLYNFSAFRVSNLKIGPRLKLVWSQRHKLIVHSGGIFGFLYREGLEDSEGSKSFLSKDRNFTKVPNLKTGSVLIGVLNSNRLVGRSGNLL